MVSEYTVIAIGQIWVFVPLSLALYLSRVRDWNHNNPTFLNLSRRNLIENEISLGSNFYPVQVSRIWSALSIIKLGRFVIRLRICHNIFSCWIMAIKNNFWNSHFLTWPVSGGAANFSSQKRKKEWDQQQNQNDNNRTKGYAYYACKQGSLWYSVCGLIYH